MAKGRVRTPQISEAVKKIKKNELDPIFFFYGEDSFNIEKTIEMIVQAVKPLLSSEFDSETFYGDDKSVNDVLDFASAFPFGSGKKFIILKEFEKIKDKKNLKNYIESPADFTILVIIYNGDISNLDTEPYKTLIKNNFIYNSKELKGENLKDWIIEFVSENGKQIDRENAGLLIDISGENKSTIESQLKKIFTFLEDQKEITIESIRALSTVLKEYSIFDLQNVIGKKDKHNALKVAFNMLEKGKEPTYIIHMLTRYFTGLSKINELKEQKISNDAAARIVGTHPYYYKDYLNARMRYSDKDLFNCVNALLEADLSVKTTSADDKTIIELLIAKILQKN